MKRSFRKQRMRYVPAQKQKIKIVLRIAGIASVLLLSAGGIFTYLNFSQVNEATAAAGTYEVKAADPAKDFIIQQPVIDSGLTSIRKGGSKIRSFRKPVSVK